MDIVELEIFKTVAEQGGVNRAAAALHRVPSNVTTRVKQLEEKLGAKLFHRQGRRLVLSSEGKVLLAYADRVLRLCVEAQAALKGNTPQGTLRLGSLESTAATRLPPILARYHTTYPAVRVELVTGTSGALVNKVLSEEVEAALVAEPFSAAGLETELAFVEELVLITPKSYPKIRTPKDIGARTVLAFTTGCSYRRRLEAWLGRANIVPERVMEYGSYHAIVACAAAGSGIAVVPRAVLRAVVAEDQVAVHALPAKIAEAKTKLIWRRGHQSSVLDALRNELARKKQ
ncbi:MAG TPA: LysR substrate-binding domain-containing protein [Burkholderiales bacterium]|nr:LysR substrate-binding domain-containing protein [Burkholderiales bacterium]